MKPFIYLVLLIPLSSSIAQAVKQFSILNYLEYCKSKLKKLLSGIYIKTYTNWAILFYIEQKNVLNTNS